VEVVEHSWEGSQEQEEGLHKAAEKEGGRSRSAARTVVYVEEAAVVVGVLVGEELAEEGVVAWAVCMSPGMAAVA